MIAALMNLITMQQQQRTNRIIRNYNNVQPIIKREVITTTSTGKVSTEKHYELSTMRRDVNGRIVVEVIREWSELH